MLYTSGSSGANQKLLIIINFNLHRPLSNSSVTMFPRFTEQDLEKKE
jgi:hypothetical protein